MTARKHGTHIHGPDLLILRQDQFGGNNIFTYYPDVLPWSGRRNYFYEFSF
jgi:hypothetical protein